jgi:signal transduction histidine kinase
VRQEAVLRAGKERGGDGDNDGDFVTTTSVAGTLPKQSSLALPRRRRSDHPGGPALVAVDAHFSARFASDPGGLAVLNLARGRALDAFRAAGADAGADRLAASLFAGDVLAGLAVEGLLRPRDTLAAAVALTDTSDTTIPAATMELFLRGASSPLLDSLPPLFAIEASLRLLTLFGVASEASLWTTRRPGRVECVVSTGDDEPTRRMRLAARLAAAAGAGLRSSRRSLIRAVPVFRWGRPEGVIVIRALPEMRESAAAFLAESATCLSPLLERAQLLDRSADRERTVVTGTERRLMRLGFDLHDGPIQDVLAAAADLRRLRDDIYPFMAEEQRDSAGRRFDDLTSRLDELDRELRELAHSLESTSAANRPVEEVLHREVETFRERSGIDATLTVEGNYAFLTSSQRVALFRAVQESLSNAREHSEASRVDIVLRSRRSWTELRIVDDGKGFRVEAALASAAKRGRLGLIGIGERVRMLGGTFEVESAPGGPTTLAVTLPRWEPLDPEAAV